MKEIQIILLLCIAAAAVLADLRWGRIPNGIIATGLCCGGIYRIFTDGIAGIVVFLGGAVLPILVLGLFYYFRMIGAGDIKLLCMAGGYFGPSRCFSCIAAAVLIGGVMSLVIMLRQGCIAHRLMYFSRYLEEYSGSRQWRSYMEGVDEDAKFCFSVPILFGMLYCVGGII